MNKKTTVLLLSVMALLSLNACGKKEKAGLYSGDQLVTPWQELIDSGVITVSNGALSSGFYENDEDGIGNTSSDALQGKLVIDKSVTSIAHSGLRYCEKLEEVVLPDSLVSIDRYAFQTCSSLKTFTIPKSLKTFSPFCLEYCYQFEEMKIDKKNTTYTVIDGVLFTKDKKTLVQFPVGAKISEYTIPKKVTKLGTGSFCLCQYLETIHIPASVKEFEASTFWGCTGMKFIDYAGNEKKWDKITKGTDWNYYCEAEINCAK